MLDRLIDFLIECLGLFKFWEVVDEYQKGVCLSLGRPRAVWWNLHRDPILEPGFHWKWPFHVERVMFETVAINSNTFLDQTLVTTDGQQITVKATCLWTVRDVRKLLIDVDSAEKTVYDAVVCAMADMIRASTWTDMCNPEWHVKLYKECRKQAFLYGVELIKLTLVDMVKTDHTIRLYQSSAAHDHTAFAGHHGNG